MDLLNFNIKEIASWFVTLSLAEKMGVVSFIFIVLHLLVQLIKGIIKLFPRKKQPSIRFKIEDVRHEIFKKKGFVSFDLYVRNNGTEPIDLIRVGFVMSDGQELGIYQQPHEIKIPDTSHLQAGQEAFYNDCDLFYALNDEGINYKKIIGLFADVRNAPRFIVKADVHPLMNDHAVRGILTDQKGLNGF